MAVQMDYMYIPEVAKNGSKIDGNRYDESIMMSFNDRLVFFEYGDPGEPFNTEIPPG